jgi:radical SAM protein with 4Fe4S-binding SPASM domain
MMCEYCPQTLINSERRRKNIDRKLEFDNFKKLMQNVSNKTQIHWSGYSEPLAHENFPEFANYLKENNYRQIISTTMFGRKNSEKFMSEFDGFKSVTFHLPDDKNLMKLKIKEEYLQNLENAIKFQASYIKDEVYFLVFGDNFAPEVEKILKKLVKENIILENSIEVRKHLHSRAGSIDVDNLKEVNDVKKDNESYVVDKSKRYYCSHKRLNQGVLLPNGDINLCCHDYSLNSIIGNLHNQNLDDIYKQKKIFKQGFSQGNNSICQKCEYYEAF